MFGCDIVFQQGIVVVITDDRVNHDGDTQPGRYTCRKTTSIAPHHAGQNPGCSGQVIGVVVSANPEIRAWHEPHRVEPALPVQPGPRRAHRLFLRWGDESRRGAGAASIHRPPIKTRDIGIGARLYAHFRSTRAQELTEDRQGHGE